MVLIEDLDSEIVKGLKRAARAYDKAHDAQLAAKEIADDKNEALRLRITEAGLRPLADGTIRFRIDGMVVKVGKPRSSVSVKDADEEDEEDAEFEAKEEEGQ